MNVEQKYKESYNLLNELVNLVEDYLEGEYDIDSFTLQSAQIFLEENKGK